MIVTALLFTLLATKLVSSQDCSPLRNCKECITSHYSCAWCEDENFGGAGKDTFKCDLKKNLQTRGCTKITSPETKTIPDKEDDVGGVDKVQVSPQEVSVTLRPGSPATFTVKVRPAEDYPVDLYYLMDMSYSMNDDLDSLQRLAGKIGIEMEKITKKYALGFGTFVDKTLSPYIRVEKDRPCTSCLPPYGFRHVLDFVSNSAAFEQGVKSQQISGNLDEPEGSFDALLQVAACENILKWRSKTKARRIVLLVTDAPFHIAGDGKLAGIVEPNDGKCHVDSTTKEYTKSTTMDYPSVAQVKQSLFDSRIQPIFAVTKKFAGLYKGIADQWKDIGATTGELLNDSSNVVELIKDSYNKIASTVRLSDDAPNGVKVEYTANCGPGQSERGSKECQDVKIGETVSFDVSVTAQACSAEFDKTKSFHVRVPGFDDILVNLNVVCKCECEDNAETDSAKCTAGNGDFVCGQCECDAGRFGNNCECDASKSSADDSNCKVNNETDIICSGQGSCVCGKCVCMQRQNPGEKIYGDKCQCTNFNCDRSKGLVCGGPQHGTCDCNSCNCIGDWIGPSCGQLNCSSPNIRKKCEDAEGGICGGKGKCNCGVCDCQIGYKGTHCERCPACPGKCSTNKDCVQCKAFKMGKYTEQECEEKCKTKFVFVPKVSSSGVRCEFQDQDDCKLYFTYGEIDSEFTLFVQKEKECPEEAPILAIILGVVGGILGIGLILLLIWRLFASMRDRIMYEKFVQEQKNSKWQRDRNPIYKEANQIFQNPTYGGQR